MGTFVLNHLGAFAASQNAGNGFGQFLTALGFGDANGAALAQIQQTLNIVNAKLDALKTASTRSGPQSRRHAARTS